MKYEGESTEAAFLLGILGMELLLLKLSVVLLIPSPQGVPYVQSETVP